MKKGKRITDTSQLVEGKKYFCENNKGDGFVGYAHFKAAMWSGGGWYLFSNDENGNGGHEGMGEYMYAWALWDEGYLRRNEVHEAIEDIPTSFNIESDNEYLIEAFCKDLESIGYIMPSKSGGAWLLNDYTSQLHKNDIFVLFQGVGGIGGHFSLPKQYNEALEFAKQQYEILYPKEDKVLFTNSIGEEFKESGGKNTVYYWNYSKEKVDSCKQSTISPNSMDREGCNSEIFKSKKSLFQFLADNED